MIRLDTISIVICCLTIYSPHLRDCQAQEGIAVEPCELTALPWIRLSDDGTGFVRGEARERFVIWGVNYDHDDDGRLLEDYWERDWRVVEEDFREIKALHANVVRIHLQLGRFMRSPTTPDEENLKRLGKLLQLAEATGLYLDVTGLGCYHKQDVPPWYDELPEQKRWDVQARFWEAVATTCRTSPAVFCYDLMNEPILPGAQQVETEWLAGELAGKYFVQRLTLDLAGRTREEVARDWVARLSSAIRSVDTRHLITVGVIPWAHVFPGAKPLFYGPEAGQPLDFVSVHFYPKKDEIDTALKALQVYDVGKPLVIEEMFPLHCTMQEMERFVEESRRHVDGWISFYWGATIAENRNKGNLQGAIVANWLEWFRDHAPGPDDANR